MTDILLSVACLILCIRLLKVERRIAYLEAFNDELGAKAMECLILHNEKKDP